MAPDGFESFENLHSIAGAEKTTVSTSDGDTILVQFVDPNAASSSNASEASKDPTSTKDSLAPGRYVPPPQKAPSASPIAKIPVLRDVPFSIHDVFKFSEGKTRFIMQVS